MAGGDAQQRSSHLPVKLLPHTLDLLTREHLRAALHHPAGLRALESLLDARDRELEREAGAVSDPDIIEGSILDTLRPIRYEKEKIRYVKEFLDLVYADCIQASRRDPGGAVG